MSRAVHTPVRPHAPSGVAALLCALLAGCVSSADLSPETAAVAVAERTTGFKPFTASNGETYDMAASLEKLGDATILLVRGSAQSPVISDIDAATSRVSIAAREYAGANICKDRPPPELSPARGTAAYDLELNGWGYKVRCVGGDG